MTIAPDRKLASSDEGLGETQLATMIVTPGLVPLTPRHRKPRFAACRCLWAPQSSSSSPAAEDTRQAVAITSSLRAFPVSSYCSLVTPLEAPASRSACPPRWHRWAGRTTLVRGGLLVTVIVTPGLVPLTPAIGSHALQRVGAVGHRSRIQSASQPKTLGLAVAITSSVRPCPVSSYCTLVTPLEAPASRVCVPATVAPLAGRTTLVLGGLLVR